jgi:hypothetical protein
LWRKFAARWRTSRPARSEETLGRATSAAAGEP